MSGHNPSPGEVGGIIAGIVAVLGLFGGGIRWLIGWRDRQRDSFYQKNVAWEARLREREAAFEQDQQKHIERIEQRLGRTERQVEAALSAYHLIAGALRQADPDNGALGRADELLRAAFQLDPIVPVEMAALLSRLGDAPQREN